jgi:hypothetical protein
LRDFLGLVVLVVAAASAAADKGRRIWFNATYPYANQPLRYAHRQKSQQQSKSKYGLNFETEQVWRNLRPDGSRPVDALRAFFYRPTDE